MIIVKTPLRISLFGGGTDYPTYFTENEGAVLGLAIDKYVWTTVRHLPPFFDYVHRLVYSKVELVRQASEFCHPVARCLLQNRGRGLEIHHDADLPARSGMGSSSSFTVGLINALAALDGTRVTKKDLARAAIEVERVLIREEGGWQDQIWAAYGGVNQIDFHRSGDWSVRPLTAPGKRINELATAIRLYFTGLSRFSSDVASTQVTRVKLNDAKLEVMKRMVGEAREIIEGGYPLAELGKVLNMSWKFKRELSPDVSTKEIDELVEYGLAAGAHGAKLLGAGGGGFLMFLVPPDDPSVAQTLRSAMGGRVEITVRPDYDGSRVMLYQPNGW